MTNRTTSPWENRILWEPIRSKLVFLGLIHGSIRFSGFLCATLLAVVTAFSGPGTIGLRAEGPYTDLYYDEKIGFFFIMILPWIGNYGDMIALVLYLHLNCLIPAIMAVNWEPLDFLSCWWLDGWNFGPGRDIMRHAN